MLLLINTNRMLPPIAPVGLDYVAGAAHRAGIETRVLDLCLADQPHAALTECLAQTRPELIGLTVRNTDDCFWPSAAWFVPELHETIVAVRRLSDAPIVLGGVGFSIFAREIMERVGADYGIRGDGEQALVELYAEIHDGRRFERVQGLIWRQQQAWQANPPAWPPTLDVPTQRDAVDNAAYFRRGGQIGLETKRGCGRHCLYCADPLAKGTIARRRDPRHVADEAEALLAQGVDVLHLCDAEFNLPLDHAMAVCGELIRRNLGSRVRWYAYLSVVPFDADLAGQMRRAGCVGINFTSDSAHPAMLAAYRQPHGKEDLARAVQLCRQNQMAVMLDLLLGGPGETPETLAHSIRFFRSIEPDCVGAGLGVRIYPNTGMAAHVAAEGPTETNPSIRRRYDGPIDLLRPTFYIAASLGERPARLVRDLIAGDERFFPPEEEAVAGAAAGQSTQRDHNYNANQSLCDAIAAGARGAYWDILRTMRSAP
jgi:tryptophan 2-C-methyltransferase